MNVHRYSVLHTRMYKERSEIFMPQNKISGFFPTQRCSIFFVKNSSPARDSGSHISQGQQSWAATLRRKASSSKEMACWSSNVCTVYRPANTVAAAVRGAAKLDFLYTAYFAFVYSDSSSIVPTTRITVICTGAVRQRKTNRHWPEP